jgi:hypothetical protein
MKYICTQSNTTLFITLVRAAGMAAYVRYDLSKYHGNLGLIFESMSTLCTDDNTSPSSQHNTTLNIPLASPSCQLTRT